MGVNIQAHARMHTNTHTDTQRKLVMPCSTDKSVNGQFIHLSFFAVQFPPPPCVLST